MDAAILGCFIATWAAITGYSIGLWRKITSICTAAAKTEVHTLTINKEMERMDKRLEKIEGKIFNG